MTGTVKQPTRATLRKYGLSVTHWEAMGERQNWSCAICGRVPRSGRLVIDHFHAKGFSRMSDTEKRRHVRGLLCSHPCNRYFVGKNQLQSATAVLDYLKKHDERNRS